MRGFGFFGEARDLALDMEFFQLVMLDAAGIGHGAAHFLFARAFAIAPVSVLAPFEYTTLIWGGLLGFLIWSELPSWLTVSGATLVIVAGLYNLHRERVRRAEGTAAPAKAGREGA